MNNALIADIARSLMSARWRQSLVAAIGVTFSITMFISLLGFMSGLNSLLDSLILNRTPHVHLFNEIQPNPQQPIGLAITGYHFIRAVKPQANRLEIRNSAAIMKFLHQDERVLGFSPKVSAPVLYGAGTASLNGVVNGIDVVAENALFKFSDYVCEGDPLDLKNLPNSILLGKGVAENLLVNIGDVIQVTNSTGEKIPLKIVGFFQLGIQEYDKVNSYASLATTQKLLGKPNTYITDIQVKLKDLEWSPAVAQEYRATFSCDAEDIQSANAQFETGSNVRNIISYAVGITLLIVAGFGIYNILNMMIYEKMDSIAILKATGFSGADVRHIFIRIALTIGFLGGLLGLFFGFVFSVIIDHIPFNTAAMPTIKTYPVDYSLKFYAIGIVFSLITTYFAGFFPARKASKIDPVIIIRGK